MTQGNYYTVEFVHSVPNSSAEKRFVSGKLECVPATDKKNAMMRVLDLLKIPPGTGIKFTNVTEM